MRISVLYVLLLVASISCNKDSSVCQEDCTQQVEIGDDQYTGELDNRFECLNAEVCGDCLKVTIQYGGCRGAEFRLIGSSAILESMPVQRNISVLPEDLDPGCYALMTVEYSFDLSPMRVSDEREILLNLVGWDEKLLYKY